MNTFGKEDWNPSVIDLVETIRKKNNKKFVYVQWAGANSTFFASLLDVLRYVDWVYGLRDVVFREGLSEIEFIKEGSSLITVQVIRREMLEKLLAQK